MKQMGNQVFLMLHKLDSLVASSNSICNTALVVVTNIPFMLVLVTNMSFRLVAVTKMSFRLVVVTSTSDIAKTTRSNNFHLPKLDS